MIATRRQHIILALLVGSALWFQWVAIKEQSLSGDGAYHLLAGHQALRYGQNSVNLEHPPLAKLVMAIPAAMMDKPLLPVVTAEDALAHIPVMHQEFSQLWRATLGARVMVLLCFVIPFFGCAYALGRSFGDHRTGVIVFAMLAFSLSVLPYLTILQTDVAISLGYLLTVFAVYKLRARYSYRNAALLGVAFGFSLSVKFSAVLLAPTILYAFYGATRKISLKRTVGLVMLFVMASCTVPTLVYACANWNYDSDIGRDTIRKFCRGQGTLIVNGLLHGKEGALLAIERRHAGLAQWLTGFFGVCAQNAIGVYNSYAFGKISHQGRWWYFPVLLLVKTPLAILLMCGISLWQRRAFVRQWRSFSTVISRYFPIIVTVGVYLTASMTSNYNLGVRHMMPIIPFLYLPLAKMMTSGKIKSTTMISVLIIETIILSPLWMSMTNTWWLGEKNPTRFAFSAGNLEYRQNFRQLADYVTRHDLRALNIVYPNLDQRVVRAYIPDAIVTGPSDLVVPGWYAVNIKVEQFIPALETYPTGKPIDQIGALWKPQWQRITRGEDCGYIAGSFHLYRIQPDPDQDAQGHKP